jgi:small subunit ribosomal protein S16
MATRIRLRRLGAKKRPFYRVVVADQRAPRDGRFIENIGKYHPLDDPSLIEIDEDRALHWLRVGAQPSDQVRNLMVKIGIWDKFVTERPGAAALVKTKADKPVKDKVSKKAAAKAAAEAEAPPVEAVEEAPVVAEAPPAEAVAVEPATDSAPEVQEAAESPLAEDTSDGGAGSASDSAAPSDETPSEEPATEEPASEETPVEETFVEETPVEETTAEETPEA